RRPSFRSTTIRRSPRRTRRTLSEPERRGVSGRARRRAFEVSATANAGRKPGASASQRGFALTIVAGARFAAPGLIVRVVRQLDLLDVDRFPPAPLPGDAPDLRDLRLGDRIELAEPAREARTETGELEHRDRRIVAEVRGAALVREALLASEVRAALRQVVDVRLAAAAHVEDDRVVVDDFRAVDPRREDAVPRRAVESSAVVGCGVVLG